MDALQAKDQIEEGLKDWDPAKDDKAEVSCFISVSVLLCNALCSCVFARVLPWVMVIWEKRLRGSRRTVYLPSVRTPPLSTYIHGSA